MKSRIINKRLVTRYFTSPVSTRLLWRLKPNEENAEVFHTFNKWTGSMLPLSFILNNKYEIFEDQARINRPDAFPQIKMKIERHLLPKVKKIKPTSIEAFAIANDLTLIIKERDSSFGDSIKFYAYFKNAEFKSESASILFGTYSGNGATEKVAIKDYIPKISGKVMVLNATHGNNRREIKVPILS